MQNMILMMLILLSPPTCPPLMHKYGFRWQPYYDWAETNIVEPCFLSVVTVDDVNCLRRFSAHFLFSWCLPVRCWIILLWVIAPLKFNFKAILDVHGRSILSTWLKHLNGLSCNCVHEFNVFFWLCVSVRFKHIQYPLFGYRLRFGVVCDMSSESDPHPAETVFLHVRALLSRNFDVCVVQSLKFIEFWFTGFIGVFLMLLIHSY